MGEIAEQYAAGGEYDQALQVAERMEPSNYKAEALANIAGMYLELGQYDLALQVAEKIKYDVLDNRADIKARTLADIAGGYAAAGQYDKALQVARTRELTHLKDYKARAIADIAGKYTAAGQEDKPAEVLASALQVVTNMRYGEGKKVSVLADIAGKYAAAGQKDKEAEILAEAFEFTQNIAELVKLSRKFIRKYAVKAEALLAIARPYAALGQKDKAGEILAQAQREAKKMRFDLKQVDTFAAIADQYTGLGQQEKAAEVLAELLQATETMREREKVSALEAIATRFTEAEESDQALKVAKTIEEVPTRDKWIGLLARASGE